MTSLRRVLVLLGALAVAIVIVEGASGVILRWRESQPLRNAAESLPVYRGIPWAGDYWREWSDACRLPQHLRYTGNGLWHLRPFHGRTINVENDGHRRVPGSRCSGAELRMFMFGGSTLWGHGSPDNETIPSHLARLFAARNTPACIRNYADWGSTSARSLQELILELRRGERPDVVVVYAGSYDVKETYFGYTRAFGNEMDQWTADMLAPPASSATMRLVQRLTRRGPQSPPRNTPQPDPATVSRTAIARLTETQRQFEALGTTYGFRTVIVLHPYLVADPKPLAPDERRMREQMEQALPALTAAIRETYRVAGANPSILSLADAFRAEHDLIYIDAGHISPKGNRIIAELLDRSLSQMIAPARGESLTP